MPANCQWLDQHFLSLQVDDTIIHLPSISQGINSLLQNLSSSFHKDVLLGLPEEIFPANSPNKQTVDNPREFSLGNSFLTNPINTCFKGSDDALVMGILRDPKLREQFVESTMDGEIQWKQGSVKQYLLRVNHWLDRLMVFSHLASGGVARVPEILGLKIKNLGG